MMMSRFLLRGAASSMRKCARNGVADRPGGALGNSVADRGETALGNSVADRHDRVAKSAASSRAVYLSEDKMLHLWTETRQGRVMSIEFADREGFETVDTRVAMYDTFLHVHDPPIYLASEDCSGCQAYMWVDGETLIIAFSGTQDHEDVMANLDVQLTPITQAEAEAEAEGCVMCRERPGVQRGFMRRHDSLSPRITDLILQMERDHVISRIVCTGHSLGGADAALCALLTILPTLKRAEEARKDVAVPVVIVHTFGSPCIGNSEFSEWANAALGENLRIVHVLDVIAYLPLRRRAVGKRITLTNVHDKDAKDRWFWERLIITFHFHMMEQYVVWMREPASARYFE